MNSHVHIFSVRVTTRPPHPFLQAVDAMVSGHLWRSRCIRTLPRTMVPRCNHIWLFAPWACEARGRLHTVQSCRAHLCSSGHSPGVVCDSRTLSAIPGALAKPLSETGASPRLPQHAPYFLKVNTPICIVGAKAESFLQAHMCPCPGRLLTPTQVCHALSQCTLPACLCDGPVRQASNTTRHQSVNNSSHREACLKLHASVS